MPGLDAVISLQRLSTNDANDSSGSGDFKSPKSNGVSSDVSVMFLGACGAPVRACGAPVCASCAPVLSTWGACGAPVEKANSGMVSLSPRTRSIRGKLSILRMKTLDLSLRSTILISPFPSRLLKSLWIVRRARPVFTPIVPIAIQQYPSSLEASASATRTNFSVEGRSSRHQTRFITSVLIRHPRIVVVVRIHLRARRHLPRAWRCICRRSSS